METIIAAIIKGITDLGAAIIPITINNRKNRDKDEQNSSDTAQQEKRQDSRISREGNVEFRKRVQKLKNNIHLTTKEKTEDSTEFPLAHKLAGIDRLTLLNFASTSFISSDFIARVYCGSDEYAKWFCRQLENGDLEANIIINSPHSYAANDAALSKMNPKGLVLAKDEIIQHNINTLLQFCEEHPHARVNLHLTDICLPYGIMLGESYADPSIDFMKIDLYSPMGSPDDADGFDNERPSFYLLAENTDTREMFELFRRVISRVKSDTNRTKIYREHTVDWLTKKPIIHRGRFSDSVPEHSVRGYFECIKNQYPMEVDILFLKDNTPIIGRDEKLVRKGLPGNCETFNLSSLTLPELRSICSGDFYTVDGEELNFHIEELMTLVEFLDMVNGKIDILLEAKVNVDATDEELRDKVKIVMDVLQYYTGNYAIHSANPYLLREIRHRDRLVAIGQISWSFNGAAVPDFYREIHTSFEFLDIVVPDFISYKLDEIFNNVKLKNICREKKIPLLAWTIYNEEDEKKSKTSQCGCDNIIIEGAPTFL